MNWKVFAVCVFAIIGSYLMLAMPVANAASVTITSGGSSISTSYSPSSYISFSADISNTATGDVRIAASNTSSNAITNTYIYKCQGRDPSSCFAQVTPVSVSGNADVTYQWSEVRDGDSYPQKANIMVIVRTSDSAGGRWVAFWSNGIRTASNTPYTMTRMEISGITIAATSWANAQLVKSFIDTKGMIPFNQWVSSVTLSGTTAYHKMESVNPPATSNQTYYSMNAVNNITGSTSFVFPFDGTRLLGGIVLSTSQNYVTGDGRCDAGESSDILGCIDCGTPSGYYCDTTRGNRQLSAITLSTSANPLVVTDCRVQNTVNVNFMISEQPTGATVVARYTLNGSAVSQISSCTYSGSVYTCPITTPAIAGCTGANYILGSPGSPNTMTFTLSFRNGTRTMTETRSTTFPSITVGSWSCGQYGCETSIGESQSNCCYDCGCAAGQYCDYTTNQPGTSACKTPVNSANMRITGIAPNWIYQHNNATGDNVVAEVQITNSPQSISVSSAACRIEDCLENLLPCSATCTVSCAQQASTNPSIYNSTCAMNFRITSGYDQRKNYTVIPIISYGISYKNASGADIIGSFDAQSSINIGSHWMGDGKCDADESNATTCFDCPCSSDYYCDTQNANRHTAGDACRLKSSLTATIGQLSQSAFGDAANLHATDIRVQVNGIPNSASFTPSCRFGGGGVGCGVTCSAPNSTGGMFCNFTIAAIDYRNSQFYDSVSKTLTVPNNTFTLNVSFRDGKKTASKGFSFALADISMEPNFHAANGDCEEELGENFENSCVDCGCGSQTEYCYITIDNFVGQCIDSSQLRLAVTATNPVMPNCTINFYKEECQFIMPTEIYASIPNAPNDLRLIDYKLSFGNESVDPACMAFPTNQNQRYSCSFVIPSVEGDNGGKINKSFSLNFTVRYSTNGTVRTQSLISDVSSFTINRIKSDRVMQCEQAMSDLSSKQKKLDQDNTMLMVFLGIAGAIAVTTCTLMGLCCIPANPTCAFGFSCGLWLFLCGLAIAIVGCIGDILMQSVDQIEQEVKQLEAQKKSLCAGSDASSMRSALDSMGDAGMSMGSIGMKILCAIGMIVMMFGAMQMMSAAPAASGAGAGAGSTTPGVIAAPLAPPPPPPAPVIL